MMKTRGRTRGTLTTPLPGLVLASAVALGPVLTACGADETSAGADEKSVGLGVTVEDGDIVLAGDVADDAPVVDLYEDYSCHYCADLVEADNVSLKEALDNGKLTLRFNTVNFLDRGEDGHSTLGGAVALAIADAGDVEVFWRYHDYAFLHREEIINWTADDFAGLAEELGVASETVAAIRDASVIGTHRSRMEANSSELEERLGDRVGVPSVFVDDAPFQLKSEATDPTTMADWVPDVVG